MIQFLLFVTPVLFPPKIDQNAYYTAFVALNPLTAPLDIFRASFDGGHVNLAQDLVSIGVSLFFLILGLFYFRKTEAYFADLA